MPRLSANLSMLFTEVDFLDRFELAAKAGFTGVECQFLYKWDREQLIEQLDKYGLDRCNADLLTYLVPGSHLKYPR